MLVLQKIFKKGQEQLYEQIFKSPIYPSHPRHDWCYCFSAILSNLYVKSFGVRYFCRMAEGDWYLECSSPCDSDCCQSQV